ncbi:putative protein DA1 [Helianthus anomalus]
MESSIMDTRTANHLLYHSIRDLYEGMNMRLNQQIPMLLVERHALNDAIIKEKNVISTGDLPETRGLCLSKELTVASLLKGPRIGGGRSVGMRTRHHKLTRRCQVNAIFVLYDLPRLLTRSVLAYELMHGWLRLHSN